MTAHTVRSKISSCTADRLNLLIYDLPPTNHHGATGCTDKHFTLKILVVAVALRATKSASHREAATVGIAMSEKNPSDSKVLVTIS